MQFSRHAAALVTTLAVGAVLGTGCGNKSGTGGGSGSSGSGGSGDAVATVSGVPISHEQFFTQLQNYAANPQNATGLQPAGRVVLQQLIGNVVLEGLAQQQGVAPSDADVDTQYANVKLLQDAQNIKTFEDRLTENGLTSQDVKDLQVRPQLAQLKLLTKGQPAPTDAEVKNYYTANVNKQFTKPARAHVRGIALANAVDAQQIYKQILAGQSFDTFLPRSLNKQLVNGEFLQWVPLDPGKNPQLAPLIKGVVATNPGKTTKPFSFQGAWWIIQVVEKKPKEVVSFDTVKPLIPFILMTQKAGQNPTAFTTVQSEERDYQTGLASTGKIAINLPGLQYVQLLNDLKNPPLPGPSGAVPPLKVPALKAVPTH